MDQRVLMVFLWLWSSAAPDDVRLVGGASRCAGILERRDGGDWRAVNVSLTEWGLTSAETVCRQLDCGSALSFRPLETSSRTEPPPDSRNLQITCSDPDDEVQLVGGSRTCSGRLEWKHHGDWRPVDPSVSDWNLKTTAEICRRLDCGYAVSAGLIEESSDRSVWWIDADCVQSKSTLKECVETGHWTTKFVLEITCSDSVRLVNGTGLCSGRLEVKSDQNWSPVCEEDLDLQSAQVVCRELDCGTPLVFKGGMFGGVEAPIWSKKFQCEGHESALLDCPDSGLTGNTCPPATAVGLTCSDPADEVQLVGGSSTCSGTLEWKHYGDWRPVDPSVSDWNLKTTAEICRRLDCGSAVSSRNIEESSDRSVWYIDSDCVQSKSTLKECVETGHWTTKFVLEITCSDSVRLVNGTGRCSGRLEVKSDQNWSPVCEEDLDLQSAQVVCRELDCGTPLVFKGGMFGGVEAPIWSKKFQCEGHESALLDCPDSGLTGNTCPPATAVGLTCSDPADEVQLVGGSSTCSGTLEWKHYGDWRPVDPSVSDWNLKTTAEICRRLDCGSAVSSRNIEESSDRSVWYIDSDCVQSKSTLKECVETDHWTTKVVLEITCSDSVRLVNGTGLCSGRLEVKSDQSWFPVCEMDLDLQSAQVVCRELDCGTPLVFKGGMFGGVDAPMWSKKFQCEGHESALLDCPDSGLTGNTCPPATAVGLTCSDPDDELQLVGGSSTCSGRLEWKHHGNWRPVYPFTSYWNLKATDKICRRLDCGSAVSSRLIEESSYRSVWVIKPECVQSRSTLKECVDTDGWYISVLEMTCSDSVRLVNGTGLCSGRLEVKSNQSWSPVCEEDLDLQVAQVVCRELDCGAPSVFEGGMFGGVEALSWTRDLQCEGNESTLLDCGGSGSARNTCSPGRPVGLSCADPDYIRLVGEPSRCAGTLEMKHMEEWRGPLVEFDSDWNQNSSAVVCKTLKCGFAVSTRRVEHNDPRPVWRIRPSCFQTASALFECLHVPPDPSKMGLEVICSDLLEKPNIFFSFSTDGVSEATPQGYQALIGTSFNITCSIRPQYEGGDFQLIFSDSVTTQSYNLTAVNHSAHFLFPPADQSHRGQYSCVYHLHVFSHHFSSESQTLSLAVGAPLRDLIIRSVVLLGGLLIYDIALYCYYKVKTKRQPPVLNDEDRVIMEIIAIPQEST